MKAKYNYLSPDGFTITPGGYDTQEEAKAGLLKWVDRFKVQGYYSSNTGRISLKDLAGKCKLITE